MVATLNPYIVRVDDARAVIEFYAQALGAKANIMTFGDMPNPELPPEMANLVMHAQIDTDNDLHIMASDGGSMMPVAPPNNAVTVALTGSNDLYDYAKKAWDVLVEGGTVIMDLAPAPWGAIYGSLVDKFGVNWMVNIEPEASAWTA
jgi:PhnB protein